MTSRPPTIEDLPLVIEAPKFDLTRTLSSGQSFRWRHVGPDHWQGIVRSSVISVRQVDGLLEAWFENEGAAQGGDLAWVKEYFDIEGNYSEPFERLIARAGLRPLLEDQFGLHILRQDPFEVLISFIISTFNNIPRIELCIRNLARLFGQSIWGYNAQEFTFPSATRLAEVSEAQLRACGLGYRSPYVIEAAARVLDLGPAFRTLGELRTRELREELLRFPGVGAKVAECVLLFGYHRLESFPIDVWVRRAMCQLFFNGRTVPDHRIAARAEHEFRADAGLAQQYLFVAFRGKHGPDSRSGRRSRA